MADINLLPQELRKEEEKLKNETGSRKEVVVDFVHGSEDKKQELPEQAKEQKKQVKNKQGLAPAKDKPTKPKKNKKSIIKTVKGFKKFKIADIKNFFKKQKEKQKEEAHAEDDADLSVNLLKEEITLQRSPKPEVLKLLIISVCIIAVVYGVSFYYKTKYNKIRSQKDGLETSIAGLDKELVILQERSENLKDADKLIDAVYLLLNSRIDWIAFLERIEDMTLDTVYYKGLKANSLDAIEISGRAKTVEDALLQIKIFDSAKDFVKDMELKNFVEKHEEIKVGDNQKAETYESSFVEFSLTFAINPDWLLSADEL